MKKISLVLVIILLITLLTATLTGCGTKYCAVSGCPQEVTHGDTYCARHECFNRTCHNRAVEDYGYCLECLQRAR